jgi:chromosome segregation ATPase
VDNKQTQVKSAQAALQAANAEKASLQSKINVAQATGNSALVKELRQEQAALEGTIKEKQSLLDQGLEELSSLRDRLSNAATDAYNYVVDGVSSVYDSVADGVQSAYSSVTDGLNEFASNAQRDAEGFAGALGDAAKKAETEIASVYQNAGDSFNDLFG